MAFNARKPIPPEVTAWFAHKDFSADYTSQNIAVWLDAFADQRKRIRSVLEIGSMEGRSAVFWLEFFPNCNLTCIDIFSPRVESKFDANLADYGSRVTKIKSRSAAALDGLKASSKRLFDLAYVDGAHDMASVLADSALVFPLVRPGGFLVWDDYLWREKPSYPGPAIDAFLRAYKRRLRVLYKGWQVIAQKDPPRDWRWLIEATFARL